MKLTSVEFVERSLNFYHAYNYRVYSNRTQAKKIIKILNFARFSGKGRHNLH